MILPAILVVCLCMCLVHGKTCPSDPEIQGILSEAAIDVQPQQLLGSWLKIYAPKSYFDSVEVSVALCENGNGAKIKVTTHDFLQSKNEDVYLKELTKQDEDLFTAEISLSDGRKLIRDNYYLHVDQNAIAFFSCDPELSLAQGWDAYILVNTAKWKKLLESSRNDVKTSYNLALNKLNHLKAKSDAITKQRGAHFGLIGEMKRANMELLKHNSNTDISV